jgi:hypothetical protein
MARIDWVRTRLENWARWARNSESGALGYPRQSAFARLGPSSQVWGASLPVDSLDASLTDQAVQSLRFTHSHLWLTLKHHYIEGYEIKRVALRLCVADSTVKARLETADALLARWFEDRASNARVRAKGDAGSFTT